MRNSQSIALAVALLACTLAAGPLAAQKESKGIEIAQVRHKGPVDFEKEILPILRRNCLACHNTTDAESDLVLETPATIREGGVEGPAVVPGKSSQSLLLLQASHQRESFMPPDDNDVGAKNLTPRELGLIKLWIDKGATGEVTGAGDVVQWQSLPAGVNPIYAVAVSDDGQFAAAGRANQVFLYHVPTGRELGRLTDPELVTADGVYQQPGVAFMDLVQSLAFNRTGDMIAAGGYRNVKIWKRVTNARLAELPAIEDAASSLAVSGDGKIAAVGLVNGAIQLLDLEEKKVIRTLEGHTGRVAGLQFSADGSTLYSGSEDKTLRAWNVANGNEKWSLETPAPVTALALVNQHKEIAAGHADNIIRIWALPGTPAKEQEEDPAAPIRELAGHGGPITSLAVAGENADQLVSGSQDGSVRHWNAADGKQLRQMDHGGPVTAVALRGDLTRIVSTSENNTVKLWNAADGKQIVEIKGDFQKQLAAQRLTRDMNLANKRVELAKSDLEEANKRKTAEEENKKKLTEAVTKAEEDKTAKVEAAKKPVVDKDAAEKTLEEAKKAQVTTETAQKKADQALTKANEELKKAQDALKTAEEALTAATKAAEEAASKKKAADEAAKNDADNKDLAAAAEAAGKAAEEAEKKRTEAQQVVDNAKKKVEADTAIQKTADEGKKKGDADFKKANDDTKAADENLKKLTPVAQKAVDEKTAAERAAVAATRSVERADVAVKKVETEIVAFDASVKVEESNAAEGKSASEASDKTVTESERPVRTASFSADGSLFAVGGDSQVVTTFDSETGLAVCNFSGQDSSIHTLAFTPDGNLLSIAENKSVVIWDMVHRWELVHRLGSSENGDLFIDRVISLHFSYDGSMLATGGGEPSRSGEIKIFNTGNAELIRELKEPHSDTVFAVEFSRDGQYIASCGADRFAKVFQVADGAFVRSFEGHTHHVLGVSWSADGRTLVTGGADNVVKVWTVKTGDQQRTISGFGKEVTSIKYVADGIKIVAAWGDKNVHVKRADNGSNVRVLGGGRDFMYTVGVTGDGKVIVAGGQDSVLRIWAEDGKVLGTFEPPAPPEEEEATTSDGGE
jgi:WD40 repeat protein